MRNAGAGGIKVDAVLGRERFDLRVLLQIFRRGVLNVVIDREHWLCRIGDFRGADLFEFRNHGAGVVMRHDVTRPDGNEIAGAHDRSLWKPICVTGGDFFNQREPHTEFYRENYFLLARLPRSLAISKSTKSA